MKKFFKNAIWFSKLALMSCCLLIGACDKDDEADNNIGTTTENDTNGTSDTPVSPIITTESGEKILLTNVQDHHPFDYNSDGSLKGFYAYDGYYNVSYNPFKVTLAEEDGVEEESGTISLNSEGLIKSLNWVYKYKDEYETISSKTDFNYTYDADKHLTQISMSHTDQSEYDGSTSNYSGNITVALTWNDGNLTKAMANYQGTWVEDGESGNDLGKEEYTISYGDTPNKHLQYTWNLGAFLTYEDELPLFMVGMMGAGPRMLPSQIVCKSEDHYDGEIEKDEDTYTYSYTLNPDGTISTATETEHYNGSTYSYTDNYTYAPLSAYSASAASIKKIDKKVEAAQKFVRSHVKKMRERRQK